MIWMQIKKGNYVPQRTFLFKYGVIQPSGLKQSGAFGEPRVSLRTFLFKYGVIGEPRVSLRTFLFKYGVIQPSGLKQSGAFGERRVLLIEMKYNHSKIVLLCEFGLNMYDYPEQIP